MEMVRNQMCDAGKAEALCLSAVLVCALVVELCQPFRLSAGTHRARILLTICSKCDVMLLQDTPAHTWVYIRAHMHTICTYLRAYLSCADLCMCPLTY